MAKPIDILTLTTPENLGTRLSEKFIDWEQRRNLWLTEKLEIQKYIYATDTTKTSNSKLPWSNKTTTPKLCQIRDNLYSNYMSAMFPKRKWLSWEANDRESNDVQKTKNIEAYMAWVIDRPEFYREISKCVLDYIDYGNAIATVEWVDDRTISDKGEQIGYVGPAVRRINPVDVFCDPTAPSFKDSAKIIRSLVSIGEVKEMVERLSADDHEREDAQKLYDKMKDMRQAVNQMPPNQTIKNAIYQIAGFSNWSDYCSSNTVEILTFYGDIFDQDTGVYLRNHVIKVVDRMWVLSKRPNPSMFGQAPIYHVGWRIRPDTIWAMGPLDNLVGMQYRIDHLENMKADVFDLIAYPPLKITGYVEPFTWGPFEHIFVGDSGNVEVMSPPFQVLQADNQIALLEMKMEEMAGSPKEAMGFRTPGEKTAYEVQRLENAASRIFQNKIGQFERDFLELLLNAKLELASRNMDKSSVRVFDQEFKVAMFEDMSAEDITGNGRIRPVAARMFAEKSQQVQNLADFFGSSVGSDPAVRMHFSTIQLAHVMEDLLDLDSWPGLVEPYVRLSEEKQAQSFIQSYQEQAAMEAQTASGLTEGDADADVAGGLPPG